MRKINFKYIKAVNFLCFGPDGFEMHFDDYGNVTQVFGLVVETGRSNGSGKSTIPEIPTYALYGKTIKPHNKIKTNIFHNKVGKKLYVEVQWENYKVIRGRKPDKLELHEFVDGEWRNISKGAGKAATQEEINKKIGMNYETFTNVVMFTDKNDESFLECDAENKRKIAENLLSLEKYRLYAKTVKDMRKALKDELTLLLKEYEHLVVERDGAVSRITSVEQQDKMWTSNLKSELTQLMNRIKTKKTEMESTNEGAALLVWQEAQEIISNVRNSIQEYEAKKVKLNEMLQELQGKRDSVSEVQHTLKLCIQTHQQEIERAKRELQADLEFIHSIRDKKGTRCPTCLGDVDEKNHLHAEEARSDNMMKMRAIIRQSEKEIVEKNEELTSKGAILSKIQEHVKAVQEKKSAVDKKLCEFNNEISTYSKVPRPEGDKVVLLLEKEIDELKRQLIEKKKILDSGETPYAKILVDARNELTTKETACKQKKKTIEEKQALMPYFDYWYEAFGDSGIRKLIISDVVPALNESISRWINTLLDGHYSLTLDSELNETITRLPADGDPFVYHAMSRGEQRTLNLSISRAFAHVMALSWGCIPSFIWLDEIGSNIDEIGKECIYKMITELSQEQQVFVTTHDKQLQNLLKGHSELHLRRENGFTTLSCEN